MGDLRLDSPEVLRAVSSLPRGLCAACAGRAFARLEPGQSNADRGRAIGYEAAESAACVLCEGIVERVPQYVDLAAEAARGFDFASFLVGSKYFEEVTAAERRLFERLLAEAPQLAAAAPDPPGGAPVWPWGEWLKNEVNRETGKALESRLGRPVRFDRPDVVLTIDTRADLVDVQAAAVFVSGRYRKLVRTLPQTAWPCRSCRGLGCRRCDGQGSTYPSSVEEEIAGPAKEAFAAQEASFHGMGREDIDALMLGTGRPFVLELKGPRRRSSDLDALAAAVNEAAKGVVEVEALAMAGPKDPARFKAASPDKTYRARCVPDAPVDQEKALKATQSLGGSLLEQRTPRRVARRRADKVRRRRVRRVELREHSPERFELEIEAESGTYIKELVSGDDGRTSPSLAQALGVGVRVDELDVVRIHWED